VKNVSIYRHIEIPVAQVIYARALRSAWVSK